MDVNDHYILSNFALIHTLTNALLPQALVTLDEFVILFKHFGFIAPKT
jgi:hypothetical protein